MKLKKPTNEVLQAFVNLRVSNDFETILEWLRDCRKTARDELEQHTQETLFARVQGRSETLKELIELSASAPEKLEQRLTRLNNDEQRQKRARTRAAQSRP